MTSPYELDRSHRMRIRNTPRRKEFKILQPSRCWSTIDLGRSKTFHPCPFMEEGCCGLISQLQGGKESYIDPQDVVECMEMISPHCPLSDQGSKILDSWDDDLTGIEEEKAFQIDEVY